MSLSVFLAAFGLIFAAEMGDKTQLVAFTLAARFNPKVVFLGIASAFAVLNLLAVTVGQALTSRLDPSWVHLAAGALFIFFGVNSIRSCSEKEDSDGDEKLSKRGPFATSFLMIFFAEMGDKTQLMTAALAARHRDFVSVFAGSTAALCLVSLLGIVLGALAAKKIPLPLIKTAAGGLFIVFGAVSLVQGAVLRHWLPCPQRLGSVLC
jgi:Predicted membrane protein